MSCQPRRPYPKPAPSALPHATTGREEHRVELSPSALGVTWQRDLKSHSTLRHGYVLKCLHARHGYVLKFLQKHHANLPNQTAQHSQTFTTPVPQRPRAFTRTAAQRSRALHKVGQSTLPTNTAMIVSKKQRCFWLLTCHRCHDTSSSFVNEFNATHAQR